MTISGVYPIDPDGQGEFDVWCDMDNGGLSVIQRNSGTTTEHFARSSWEEYKTGFGDMFKEFWLGNEKIHRITSSMKVTLNISITGQGKTGSGEYTHFSLANEQDNYRLNISGFSGDIGDSFNHAANGKETEAQVVATVTGGGMSLLRMHNPHKSQL